MPFKAQIGKDEALKIIEKIDYNRDGVITWEEFLQAMYEWLKSSNYLNIQKKSAVNPTVTPFFLLNLT